VRSNGRLSSDAEAVRYTTGTKPTRPVGDGRALVAPADGCAVGIGRGGYKRQADEARKYDLGMVFGLGRQTRMPGPAVAVKGKLAALVARRDP
jgi:hypothetical protein